jgi:hypothetical protein
MVVRTNSKDEFFRFILIFLALDVFVFLLKGVKHFYISSCIFLILLSHHILTEQILEVEILEDKITITYLRFFREYKKQFSNQKLILKRFTKVHFRVSKKIDVLQLFEGKKLLAELTTLIGIESIELDEIEMIVKESSR